MATVKDNGVYSSLSEIHLASQQVGATTQIGNVTLAAGTTRWVVRVTASATGVRQQVSTPAQNKIAVNARTTGSTGAAEQTDILVDTDATGADLHESYVLLGDSASTSRMFWLNNGGGTEPTGTGADAVTEVDISAAADLGEILDALVSAIEGEAAFGAARTTEAARWAVRVTASAAGARKHLATPAQDKLAVSVGLNGSSRNAEQVDILVAGGTTGADLHESYVLLGDSATTTRMFWFDNGGGTEPSGTGADATTAVDISAAADLGEILDALVTAIDGESAFGAAKGAVVHVACAAAGTRPFAWSAGNLPASTAVVTTDRQGTSTLQETGRIFVAGDGSLFNGKYLRLSDASGTFHVRFNGYSSNAGTTNLAVDVSADADARAVAETLAAALDGHASFEATHLNSLPIASAAIRGNILRIAHDHAGSRAAPSAGTAADIEGARVTAVRYTTGKTGAHERMRISFGDIDAIDFATRSATENAYFDLTGADGTYRFHFHEDAGVSNAPDFTDVTEVAVNYAAGATMEQVLDTLVTRVQNANVTSSNDFTAIRNGLVVTITNTTYADYDLDGNLGYAGATLASALGAVFTQLEEGSVPVNEVQDFNFTGVSVADLSGKYILLGRGAATDADATTSITVWFDNTVDGSDVEATAGATTVIVNTYDFSTTGGATAGATTGAATAGAATIAEVVANTAEILSAHSDGDTDIAASDLSATDNPYSITVTADRYGRSPDPEARRLFLTTGATVPPGNYNLVFTSMDNQTAESGTDVTLATATTLNFSTTVSHARIVSSAFNDHESAADSLVVLYNSEDSSAILNEVSTLTFSAAPASGSKVRLYDTDGASVDVWFGALGSLTAARDVGPVTIDGTAGTAANMQAALAAAESEQWTATVIGAEVTLTAVFPGAHSATSADAGANLTVAVVTTGASDASSCTNDSLIRAALGVDDDGGNYTLPYWLVGQATVGGGTSGYTLTVQESDSGGHEDVIVPVDVSSAGDGTVWALVVPCRDAHLASREFSKTVTLTSLDANRVPSATSPSFTFKFLTDPTFSTPVQHSNVVYEVARATANLDSGMPAVLASSGNNNAQTNLWSLALDTSEGSPSGTNGSYFTVSHAACDIPSPSQTAGVLNVQAAQTLSSGALEIQLNGAVAYNEFENSRSFTLSYFAPGVGAAVFNPPDATSIRGALSTAVPTTNPVYDDESGDDLVLCAGLAAGSTYGARSSGGYGLTSVVLRAHNDSDISGWTDAPGAGDITAAAGSSNTNNVLFEDDSGVVYVDLGEASRAWLLNADGDHGRYILLPAASADALTAVVFHDGSAPSLATLQATDAGIDAVAGVDLSALDGDASALELGTALADAIAGLSGWNCPPPVQFDVTQDSGGGATVALVNSTDGAQRSGTAYAEQTESRFPRTSADFFSLRIHANVVALASGDDANTYAQVEATKGDFAAYLIAVPTFTKDSSVSLYKVADSNAYAGNPAVDIASYMDDAQRVLDVTLSNSTNDVDGSGTFVINSNDDFEIASTTRTLGKLRFSGDAEASSSAVHSFADAVRYEEFHRTGADAFDTGDGDHSVAVLFDAVALAGGQNGELDAATPRYDNADSKTIMTGLLITGGFGTPSIVADAGGDSVTISQIYHARIADRSKAARDAATASDDNPASVSVAQEGSASALHITDLDFTSATPATISGHYFTVTSGNGSNVIWFNNDNNDSAPSIGQTGVTVEVDVTGLDAAGMANALVTACELDSTLMDNVYVTGSATVALTKDSERETWADASDVTMDIRTEINARVDDSYTVDVTYVDDGLSQKDWHLAVPTFAFDTATSDYKIKSGAAAEGTVAVSTGGATQGDPAYYTDPIQAVSVDNTVVDSGGAFSLTGSYGDTYALNTAADENGADFCFRTATAADPESAYSFSEPLRYTEYSTEFNCGDGVTTAVLFDPVTVSPTGGGYLDDDESPIYVGSTSKTAFTGMTMTGGFGAQNLVTSNAELALAQRNHALFIDRADAARTSAAASGGSPVTASVYQAGADDSAEEISDMDFGSGDVSALHGTYLTITSASGTHVVWFNNVAPVDPTYDDTAPATGTASTVEVDVSGAADMAAAIAAMVTACEADADFVADLIVLGSAGAALINEPARDAYTSFNEIVVELESDVVQRSDDAHASNVTKAADGLGLRAWHLAAPTFTFDTTTSTYKVADDAATAAGLPAVDISVATDGLCTQPIEGVSLVLGVGDWESGVGTFSVTSDGSLSTYYGIQNDASTGAELCFKTARGANATSAHDFTGALRYTEYDSTVFECGDSAVTEAVLFTPVTTNATNPNSVDASTPIYETAVSKTLVAGATMGEDTGFGAQTLVASTGGSAVTVAQRFHARFVDRQNVARDATTLSDSAPASVSAAQSGSSSQPEITDVSFEDVSTGASLENHYITLTGRSGTHVVWFNAGSGSEPATGTASTVEVDISGDADDMEAIIASMVSACEGSSAFYADFYVTGSASAALVNTAVRDTWGNAAEVRTDVRSDLRVRADDSHLEGKTSKLDEASVRAWHLAAPVFTLASPGDNTDFMAAAYKAVHDVSEGITSITKDDGWQADNILATVSLANTVVNPPSDENTDGFSLGDAANASTYELTNDSNTATSIRFKSSYDGSGGHTLLHDTGSGVEDQFLYYTEFSVKHPIKQRAVVVRAAANGDNNGDTVTATNSYSGWGTVDQTYDGHTSAVTHWEVPAAAGFTATAFASSGGVAFTLSPDSATLDVSTTGVHANDSVSQALTKIADALNDLDNYTAVSLPACFEKNSDSDIATRSVTGEYMRVNVTGSLTAYTKAAQDATIGLDVYVPAASGSDGFRDGDSGEYMQRISCGASFEKGLDIVRNSNSSNVTGWFSLYSDASLSTVLQRGSRIVSGNDIQGTVYAAPHGIEIDGVVYAGQDGVLLVEGHTNGARTAIDGGTVVSSAGATVASYDGTASSRQISILDLRGATVADLNGTSFTLGKASGTLEVQLSTSSATDLGSSPAVVNINGAATAQEVAAAIANALHDAGIGATQTIEFNCAAGISAARDADSTACVFDATMVDAANTPSTPAMQFSASVYERPTFTYADTVSGDMPSGVALHLFNGTRAFNTGTDEEIVADIPAMAITASGRDAKRGTFVHRHGFVQDAAASADSWAMSTAADASTSMTGVAVRTAQAGPFPLPNTSGEDSWRLLHGSRVQPVVAVAESLNNTNHRAGGTIDGVTLKAGDLFLVKDSSADAGVYVVNDSGTAPSRATQYPAGGDGNRYYGTKFWCLGGTERVNKLFELAQSDSYDEAGDIDIGTTVVSFTELSGQKLVRVQAASTANADLSGDLAGASMDGVTLSAGDAILLQDQTDATENGVYTVASGAGNTARHTDYNGDNNMVGISFLASEGSANAGKAFRLDKPDVTVLGTDDQTFEEDDRLYGWSEIQVDAAPSDVSAEGHAVLFGGTDVAPTANVLHFGSAPSAVSVAAVSASAVTLADVDAGYALDGVTLSDGDLVLLKDQATASENGVWRVNADTVAPTRHDSYNTFAEHEQVFFTAAAGTANSGATFTLYNAMQTGVLYDEDAEADVAKTVVGTASMTFAAVTFTQITGVSNEDRRELVAQRMARAINGLSGFSAWTRGVSNESTTVYLQLLQNRTASADALALPGMSYVEEFNSHVRGHAGKKVFALAPDTTKIPSGGDGVYKYRDLSITDVTVEDSSVVYLDDGNVEPDGNFISIDHTNLNGTGLSVKMTHVGGLGTLTVTPSISGASDISFNASATITANTSSDEDTTGATIVGDGYTVDDPGVGATGRDVLGVISVSAAFSGLTDDAGSAISAVAASSDETVLVWYPLTAVASKATTNVHIQTSGAGLNTNGGDILIPAANLFKGGIAHADGSNAVALSELSASVGSGGEHLSLQADASARHLEIASFTASSIGSSTDVSLSYTDKAGTELEVFGGDSGRTLNVYRYAPTTLSASGADEGGVYVYLDDGAGGANTAVPDVSFTYSNGHPLLDGGDATNKPALGVSMGKDAVGDQAALTFTAEVDLDAYEGKYFDINGGRSGSAVTYRVWFDRGGSAPDNTGVTLVSADVTDGNGASTVATAVAAALNGITVASGSARVGEFYATASSGTVTVSSTANAASFALSLSYGGSGPSGMSASTTTHTAIAGSADGTKPFAGMVFSSGEFSNSDNVATVTESSLVMDATVRPNVGSTYFLRPIAPRAAVRASEDVDQYVAVSGDSPTKPADGSDAFLWDWSADSVLSLYLAVYHDETAMLADGVDVWGSAFADDAVLTNFLDDDVLNTTTLRLTSKAVGANTVVNEAQHGTLGAVLGGSAITEFAEGSAAVRHADEIDFSALPRGKGADVNGSFFVANAAGAKYAVHFNHGDAIHATPVRVISTSNVTISGLVTDATLDGVVLSAGDLVLLAGQTDATENGVYTVTGTAGAPARTVNFNTGAKLFGAEFRALDGTESGNTWSLSHVSASAEATAALRTHAARVPTLDTDYIYFASGTRSAVSAVAATATEDVNVTSGLANESTVGGVTLSTGDLVLLTAQTPASENGVYVVPASGTAARHSAWATAAALNTGLFQAAGGDNTGIFFTPNGTNWVNTGSGNLVEVEITSVQPNDPAHAFTRKLEAAMGDNEVTEIVVADATEGDSLTLTLDDGSTAVFGIGTGTDVGDNGDAAADVASALASAVNAGAGGDFLATVILATVNNDPTVRLMRYSRGSGTIATASGSTFTVSRTRSGGVVPLTAQRILNTASTDNVSLTLYENQIDDETTVRLDTNFTHVVNDSAASSDAYKLLNPSALPDSSWTLRLVSNRYSRRTAAGDDYAGAEILVGASGEEATQGQSYSTSGDMGDINLIVKLKMDAAGGPSDGDQFYIAFYAGLANFPPRAVMPVAVRIPTRDVSGLYRTEDVGAPAGGRLMDASMPDSLTVGWTFSDVLMSSADYDITDSDWNAESQSYEARLLVRTPGWSLSDSVSESAAWHNMTGWLADSRNWASDASASFYDPVQRKLVIKGSAKSGSTQFLKLLNLPERQMVAAAPSITDVVSANLIGAFATPTTTTSAFAATLATAIDAHASLSASADGTVITITSAGAGAPSYEPNAESLGEAGATLRTLTRGTASVAQVLELDLGSGTVSGLNGRYCTFDLGGGTKAGVWVGCTEPTVEDYTRDGTYSSGGWDGPQLKYRLLFRVNGSGSPYAASEFYFMRGSSELDAGNAVRAGDRVRNACWDADYEQSSPFTALGERVTITYPDGNTKVIGVRFLRHGASTLSSLIGEAAGDDARDASGAMFPTTPSGSAIVHAVAAEKGVLTGAVAGNVASASLSVARNGGHSDAARYTLDFSGCGASDFDGDDKYVTLAYGRGSNETRTALFFFDTAAGQDSSVPSQSQDETVRVNAYTNSTASARANALAAAIQSHAAFHWAQREATKQEWVSYLVSRASAPRLLSGEDFVDDLTSLAPDGSVDPWNMAADGPGSSVVRRASGSADESGYALASAGPVALTSSGDAVSLSAGGDITLTPASGSSAMVGGFFGMDVQTVSTDADFTVTKSIVIIADTLSTSRTGTIASATGRMVWVRNNSPASQTVAGISIADGARAMLVYDGSEWYEV